MGLPVIGPRIQKKWIQEGRDSNWILPVGPLPTTISIGAPISTGERLALPALVAGRLLDEAGGFFAMHACPCRTAFHCQHHPADLGCLFIGEAALNIPAEVGRVLERAEAHDHLQRAVQSGLIPTILYIASEAEIFQVEPTRLLAICFCCECCCDVRMLLRGRVDRYWEQYNHRLPGLQMVVSDACTGCGTCQAACYGGEKVINLSGNRAEISDRCIGCGRCISACPRSAISAQFDEQVDWMEELLSRIRERVEIGPS
jgi:UDP-glucose 4-epimerase